MGELQQNDQSVSMGEWLGSLFLTAIPVVGFVMLLVWAFGGGAKASKRNFFRAYLLFSIIMGVVAVVLSIIFSGTVLAIASTMASYS